MRLFVSIPIPSKAREALVSALEILKRRFPGARWMPAAQWHFTLKFLGETPEERLASLKESLRSAARGRGPFAVSLGGFGVFPNERAARILWAGVTAGGAEMERLAAGLEDELEKAGFAREARPFHPHLTVCRFNLPPARPPVILTDTAKQSFGAFRVEALELMESFLKPSGADYRLVDRYVLGGSA